MRIVELIVALLFGLAIGIGLTMALGVESPKDDVGNWLAFVGALVGVIVTILGTLWVEYYRSSTQETRQRKGLLVSLNEMEGALTLASAERGAEPIAEARPNRITAETNLLEKFDKFVFARHFVPNHDVNAWYAIETLQAGITRERPMIENERRIIQESGDNEAVFAVHLSKVSDAVERILPLLHSAKTEVGRPLSS